jgi:molybdate transport system ATP-binding protein
MFIHIEQHLPMLVKGQFSCKAGELLALVGPSGAGKSSLLRIVAGFMRPKFAHIEVNGLWWNHSEKGICLSPQARRVGMVFQNYALMPHLNAIENVRLSISFLRKKQGQLGATEWLEKMHLSAHDCKRYPYELSGGQQQRVALARALAGKPDLLLLDEPFSSVDQMSRHNLYTLLKDLRKDLNIPIILVTHDLHEACLLCDKLVVMDKGEVLQQADPSTLYQKPNSLRVAQLLGITKQGFL